MISCYQGVDDAFALILAVAAGLTIEGVTIVHGNGGDVKALGINAKCCLRIAGADPNLQVYLGSSDPVEYVKLDASNLQGVNVRSPARTDVSPCNPRVNAP